MTTIRTARSSGPLGSLGTDTEAGSMLGTPAYMPPEQANGDIAHLDRRADVFGLGAILCVILTGEPPYVGRSSEEVCRKACNGDLAEAMARLDGCGADPELIALARHCLSPEASDRPKDAQGVVDALTAYLDGVQERLQTAERERAVALAREVEERKRHTVQLALAASVLAMMLGVGAFAFWWNEQAQLVRQRDARNAEAVAAFLNQCEEALRAGDAAKAAVALEAARKRLAEGGAEGQAQRLGRLEADLTLSRDLDAVDQFRWTWVENKFPDLAVVAIRTRDALQRFGADPESVSLDDAAARVSASVVRERIVSAVDRLLPQGKTTGVRALLRRVDSQPYRDAVRDSILAGDRPKFVELVGQQAVLEQPPGFVAFLGESGWIPVERRRQLLHAAVSRRWGDRGLLMTLGKTYPVDKTEGVDERLRWCQAAVAAAPANVAALNNLGNTLSTKGQVDEAIACFTKAIALDPKFATARYNLGNALNNKGQVDEAIACFTKAVELDPKSAFGHNNLGNALKAKGQLDEAIACYEKAIELDPKSVFAHSNLGNALTDKGQLDGAIACYRKAIELDSKFANADYSLGNALSAKGQLDEAIAAYKKAIELNPKHAFAHNNLGNALRNKGQLDDAIACFRKAIELDPKYAVYHNGLGLALAAKGQLDEALAAHKRAIELNPKNAEAHCNLGGLLATQGRFAESLEAYKRGHELGTKQPGWRYPSANWVRSAEMRAAMEPKLSAFLQGEFQPNDTEQRLVLAHLCQIKKLNHTAAVLYAAAFAGDPKLADDLKIGHRYNAAKLAALAAAGQGADAAKLDDKERTRLRQQAFEWLKADLAAWGNRLDSGSPQDRPAIVKTLSHWQQDTDLAGIRSAAALARIPVDEQKAFTQLWADVSAFLKKAQTPATKESKP